MFESVSLVLILFPLSVIPRIDLVLVLVPCGLNPSLGLVLVPLRVRASVRATHRMNDDMTVGRQRACRHQQPLEQGRVQRILHANDPKSGIHGPRSRI